MYPIALHVHVHILYPIYLNNLQSITNILIILPFPSVIIDTLNQSHPQYFIKLSSLWTVGPVALVGHLEAIFLLCIHIAAVCRAGSTVDAEVTAELEGFFTKFKEYSYLSYGPFCLKRGGKS